MDISRCNTSKQTRLGNKNCWQRFLIHRNPVLTQEIDNILKCSPEAIKKSKELLKNLTGEKAESFFELTTNILANSWDSKEGKQGIQAFFEKRPAPWVKLRSCSCKTNT